MQLKRVFGLVALASLVAVGAADGQSLTPMHKEGSTPSDTKGFRLTVGNPYQQKMQFRITAMNPSFTRPALDAVVTPDRVTLAPGFSRSVTVAFKIGKSDEERTIGVCVTPEGLDNSPVQPRVCGTYTGVLLGHAGR